jgi:hypothetical protein
MKSTSRPSSWPPGLRDRAARMVAETRGHRLGRGALQADPPGPGRRRAAPGERDPADGVGVFRGGTRPPAPAPIDYVPLHKDEFGVEPICSALPEHGIKIAPSTYDDNASRQPSRRQVRDEQLIVVITADRAANRFAARSAPARCGCVTTCPLHGGTADGPDGHHGLTRGRAPRTTFADPAAARPADLVDRNFGVPPSFRTVDP